MTKSIHGNQGAVASQPPIKINGGLETTAPCSRQRNRNIDQTKTDAAFPDCSHTQLLRGSRERCADEDVDLIWGAGFGALAETFLWEKVRDRGGAIASTRGACAPQTSDYAAASSSSRAIPRSSKRRINVSSIKLFGQDAPAVMPTTVGPLGSQKCETISRFSCKL